MVEVVQHATELETDGRKSMDGGLGTQAERTPANDGRGCKCLFFEVVALGRFNILMGGFGRKGLPAESRSMWLFSHLPPLLRGTRH